MISYNDYTAAVDRLRRVDGGEHVHEVYRCHDFPHERLAFDKATVYDAEHDQTPASVEWLRDVLGEPMSTRSKSVEWNDPPFEFNWYCDSGDKRFLILGREFKRNPTRGDVLTALRLFKKEGA